MLLRRSCKHVPCAPHSFESRAFHRCLPLMIRHRYQVQRGKHASQSPMPVPSLHIGAYGALNDCEWRLANAGTQPALTPRGTPSTCMPQAPPRALGAWRQLPQISVPRLCLGKGCSDSRGPFCRHLREVSIGDHAQHCKGHPHHLFPTNYLV